MSGLNNTPAGWYPAPEQPGQDRYWDGARWTDTFRPAETTAPAPPLGAPGAPVWAGQGATQGWQPQAGPPPQSNLVFGILTTLFCCLPFGIVSIVKASQVNGLWAQGRTAEARDAADSAKQWALISAGVSVVVTVGMVLVLVVGSAGSSSSGF